MPQFEYSVVDAYWVNIITCFLAILSNVAKMTNLRRNNTFLLVSENFAFTTLLEFAALALENEKQANMSKTIFLATVSHGTAIL